MSTSEDESTETWISWFCSQRGNSEFFCEVDTKWIEDKFNLTGLSEIVPHYEKALDLILEIEIDDDPEFLQDIERSAELLYGLIHARYILTPRGIEAMFDKYRDSKFGRCPRVHCDSQRVLPIGLSDTARQSSVKLFCPRCQEMYLPRARYQHIDGAFFGTTFATLLFFYMPDRLPPQNPPKYVPKIYGFKIHSSAVERQKMQLKDRQEGRIRDI